MSISISRTGLQRPTSNHGFDATLARVSFVLLLALWLPACAGNRNLDASSGPVTLLAAPIENAQITRGFGRSRHPILGYSRMHRGVDYVAPRGTPVRATGDGVVERAGWHAGYGRYIRIRHAGGVRTAYAHLSHIAANVHVGATLAIGTVIGLSGSSGLSTGPHLHYEVWQGQIAVDPASLGEPQFTVLRTKIVAARN